MENRRYGYFSLLLCALVLWVARPDSARSADPFDQLVKASQAEMAKKEGKLSIAMEWRQREGEAVLKAFRKDFPFIKETTYVRQRARSLMRWIIQIRQGEYPEYDIMRVGNEFWSEYRKAGLFVKPPFEYKELAKSLPPGWPELNPRVIDPNGYFVATTGQARGNAWNPQLVPEGKEPTTWETCLDPMWKGKLLYDPRNKLAALQHDPTTRERHLKWLKGIMENAAVLNRGQTENLQKVAAGEFPLACGVNYHSTFRLIDQGAPIKFAFADPLPLEVGGQIHVVKWSKTPATTQLWSLWIATGGQGAVEKSAYRGFPWDPKSRKYPLAKGKYIAICDADCVLKSDQYDKEHADILNLPGIR